VSEREEMAAFYKIKEALKEVATKKGLYMVEESFAVLPNRDGPDFVQALFIIGDRALDGRGIEDELSAEDQKVKDEFDAMISFDEDLTTPQAPIDLRKDDAVEDLKSWLDGEGNDK
jgi:hypothetical protein